MIYQGPNCACVGPRPLPYWEAGPSYVFCTCTQYPCAQSMWAHLWPSLPLPHPRLMHLLWCTQNNVHQVRQAKFCQWLKDFTHEQLSWPRYWALLYVAAAASQRGAGSNFTTAASQPAKAVCGKKSGKDENEFALLCFSTFYLLPKAGLSENLQSKSESSKILYKVKVGLSIVKQRPGTPFPNNFTVPLKI